VSRIYTDLAVIDVTSQGLAVVDIVEGLSHETLERLTGVPLARSSRAQGAHA
jgi:3-oxoadipate CoA-transferase beta subunit